MQTKADFKCRHDEFVSRCSACQEALGKMLKTLIDCKRDFAPSALVSYAPGFGPCALQAARKAKLELDLSPLREGEIHRKYPGTRVREKRLFTLPGREWTYWDEDKGHIADMRVEVTPDGLELTVFSMSVWVPEPRAPEGRVCVLWMSTRKAKTLDRLLQHVNRCVRLRCRIAENAGYERLWASFSHQLFPILRAIYE